MATQKRRIVYFSDEEWEGIRSLAKERSITASEYIRRATTVGVTFEAGSATVTITPPPVRDASVDFRFRPVPKPGKRS